MSPDDPKPTGPTPSSPSRLTADPDLLLDELERNQQTFSRTIFWRDVREVGTGLLMTPLWIFLGVKLSLPWTWYLMAPVLAGVAGYLLADRLRHRRRLPGPGEPLRPRLEGFRAQVEHQIWLLRNVFWWYLLPIGLAMLAFFGQIAWKLRSGGWTTAFFAAGMVLVEVMVFAGVYWLNQHAVRSVLVPRRQELEALLLSLKDETS